MPNMEFDGRHHIFDEMSFGISYATNITPDPETGIGKWTDAPDHRRHPREASAPMASIIGPPPCRSSFYREPVRR